MYGDVDKEILGPLIPSRAMFVEQVKGKMIEGVTFVCCFDGVTSVQTESLEECDEKEHKEGQK